jgi:hypothetical protein
MQQSSIDLVTPLMDLVDDFVREYERLREPLSSDLERALVIAWVLSAMRCDLDVIWEGLVATGIFGAGDPSDLLDQCATRQEMRQALLRDVQCQVRVRGWVHDEAPAEDAPS